MLDTPFVVQLVGIAPAPAGQVASPWVVLELMSEGSLLELLKRLRAQGKLTLVEQLQWASDAAHGLCFMHSKGLVHRDVAARSVMATYIDDAGRICCKISDLGMSREMRGETFSSGTPEATPVAWMAPDALDGVFSMASDVYSYGVLLWEIVKVGAATPFAGAARTHAELRPKIKAGLRLARLAAARTTSIS